MPRDAAPSMFAALLDRSVTRIGELAADGRAFDRIEVYRLADVWDNNTFPFLHVAVSSRFRREEQARDALRWMAGLGPERRAWVSEVTGDRLLGPAALQHRRDHQGRVQPEVEPLTEPADYALDRATLRGFLVERAGTRLTGHVSLAVSRRFEVPDGNPDAVIGLHFDDLREVRLDSADRTGAALAPSSAAASSSSRGVRLRIGERGLLVAPGGTLSVDDPCWHLSPAGRAADAITPAAGPDRRDGGRSLREPRLSVDATDTGFVLRLAMLMVRSVRYAKQVGRVPLREITGALTGAGEAVLSAGSRPWPVRDRALRRLAGGWLDASPYLVRELRRMLPDSPSLSGRPTGAPPDRPGLPARGQLTLATFRDGGGVVNVAADGTWELRSAELADVPRLAVETSAFTGSRAVSSLWETG